MLAKGGFSAKGWISNKDVSKGSGNEKISDVTQVFEGGAEVDKVLRVVWNHRASFESEARIDKGIRRYRSKRSHVDQADDTE